LHGAESIILSAGVAETIILSVGGAENMMLSACAESMIVSALLAASMILSVPFHHVIMIVLLLTAARRGGQQKKQQSGILTIPNDDFGQQRLNGTANWSATKDDQVFPHFQQIVSGALMPPCPTMAVC
jgi:hypothetical protein